jgi:hypothetical protein
MHAEAVVLLLKGCAEGVEAVVVLVDAFGEVERGDLRMRGDARQGAERKGEGAEGDGVEGPAKNSGVS